jgi:hypothetical protein
MSLFVHPENQKLLWNVVSKNMLVSDYFSGFPSKKEEWFKSIVQSIYEHNKYRTINQSELLIINKEAISYMIQNVKNAKSVQPPTPPPNDQTFLKSYSITENKVEKIGNQFTEKQLEYNSLFEKKVPETIEFGEAQDKPLSNMDELIKKHMEERESELKKYAPLPLVTPPTEVRTVEPIKLKIDKTQENVTIQIEEIDQPTKKSVSWLDDANTEKLERQQIEINELKSQVLELTEKLINLEKSISVK